MSTPILRTIYCPHCKTTGTHEIKYHGTKQNEKRHTLAVFDSDCFHCNALYKHEVPIRDYNALTGRIIYDYATAP